MLLMEGRKTEREMLRGYALDPRIGVHLSCIVDYLTGTLPFPDLIRHAQSLKERGEQRLQDPDDLMTRVQDENIPTILLYIRSVSDYAYLNGSFDDVNCQASALIRLRSLPPDSQITPTSPFYQGKEGRTLADARREV